MVEDLDDDPYLAELLGLTKDDEPALGAGGKAKASSAAAASGSKASSSSVAAAQQSQSSPTKAPSYRSSGR